MTALARIFHGATAPSPWFARQPQRERCGSKQQRVVRCHSEGEISGLALPVHRPRWLIALYAASATLLAASPVERKFDFGSGPAAAGWVSVNADTAYTGARGYGFEPGAAVTAGGRSGGSPADDFCTAAKPFFFSVDLPEGDYRVTLTLGDRNGTSDTVVKAESRRLVLRPVTTGNGDVVTATFAVNIRNPRLPDGGRVRLKPRETDALHWDDRLTLEFNGSRPCVAAMRIERADDIVTVFLAGDSTVTDQQLEPWAAWGQMLPAFFDATVAVANHAESGETIKSFVDERRLDKVMSLIKPGDWLLIQFGHNDQKQGVNHTDAATGFKEYLRRFISDVRAKGAHPALVTSMERRRFDPAGNITPTLKDYPRAMREIGAELNVPVIDLNAMSIRFYEALGPEAAKRAFIHFAANTFPDQPAALSDDTHFSSYGAYELARCVVQGIKETMPALAARLRPDAGDFDPAHPDDFSDWHPPASPPKPLVKPEGS